MDDKVTQEIRKLMAEIVRQEIKKIMPNIEKVYDGKVCVDDEGNHIVKVKGQQFALNEMKNCSGQDLNNGDIVRIYAKGDKLNNAYIGAAFK